MDCYQSIHPPPHPSIHPSTPPPIHPSINSFIHPAYPLKVVGRAEPNSSWHWGLVHPQQVSSVSQGQHTDTNNHSHSLQLTPVSMSLDCGRSRCTWKNPWNTGRTCKLNPEGSRQEQGSNWELLAGLRTHNTVNEDHSGCLSGLVIMLELGEFSCSSHSICIVWYCWYCRITPCKTKTTCTKMLYPWGPTCWVHFPPHNTFVKQIIFNLFKLTLFVSMFTLLAVCMLSTFAGALLHSLAGSCHRRIIETVKPSGGMCTTSHLCLYVCLQSICTGSPKQGPTQKKPCSMVLLVVEMIPRLPLISELC